MADAFILGLSSGSACLVTCGIVMFPFLMARSAGSGRIAADLFLFLAARLIIYLVLAGTAWYCGQALFSNHVIRNIIPGILYMVFAVLLISFAIGKKPGIRCPAIFIRAGKNHRLIPVFLGLVNSLGFCPALLIILIKTASEGTLLKSYMSFLAFFAGSSLWFIPLPLAGKIKKREILEIIGLLATGLAAIIFMIKGITNLIGGIING